MLELCSKKRFIVILKDQPFEGDWNNCYLKENDKEIGKVSKAKNFIVLKDFSLKFPYDEFFKLLDSFDSSFIDLLLISPNVLKISDNRTVIEKYAMRYGALWREFFNEKTQKQNFFAFKF